MQIDAKTKSLFIFPAFGIVSLLLVISIVQFFADDVQRIAWAGAAIAALPFPLLMARVKMAPLQRTSDNLTALMFVGSAGFVIAAWQHLSVWQDFGIVTPGLFPTVTASVALLLFTVYVFWYSRFGRIASGQLSVGSKLPAFELRDTSGELFSSDSLQGAPALLLFYRGNWCPFCTAQIAELVERYKDLDALGVRVFLISPQSADASRELASKFDVPFTFLVDQDNELAESLNIAVSNGVPVGIPGDYSPETVMPTLVVVNDNGTIVFSDQTDNYRVRPEPDVFLSILRRSGALSK